LLFETIRCEHGKALNIGFHEERMRRFGGKHFELSFLSPPAHGIYRCKLIYSEDIASVEYSVYEKKQIMTLKPIESDISYSHKFLDRSGIDALFEKRDKADDILIIKNSYITDTSIANIAFLDMDGNWLTPKTPLLLGTMRQQLINNGFLAEKDIKIEDIGNFTEVAIMNALRGFESLGQVNDVIRF